MQNHYLVKKRIQSLQKNRSDQNYKLLVMKYTKLLMDFSAGLEGLGYTVANKICLPHSARFITCMLSQ